MQKPQARVQRSPLIMKVAVPSFQQSNTFGHPASSQTVVSRLLRIVDLRRRYSGPVSSVTRIHSGLRPTGGRAPAPSPRLKRLRSPVRCTQATSARSTGPSAHRSAARPATRSTTWRIVVVIPSAASEVTP